MNDNEEVVDQGLVNHKLKFESVRDEVPNYLLQDRSGQAFHIGAAEHEYFESAGFSR